VKNIFSKIIFDLYKCIDFDFSRRVLQISSGVENTDGIVLHLAIALAAAWLICFLALSKGVQSLGKVKSLVSNGKKRLLFSYIK
jgi:hypothetical protein